MHKESQLLIFISKNGMHAYIDTVLVFKVTIFVFKYSFSLVPERALYMFCEVGVYVCV